MAKSKIPAKEEQKPVSTKLDVQLDTIEERKKIIAEAAYFIAEHRGFTAGAELSDWLQAERDIESTLSHH